MQKNIFIILISFILLVGCAPKEPSATDLLTLTETPTEVRQLQSKIFYTEDELLILRACSTLLQDMGFGIGETSEELGSLTAEKSRDARELGQDLFSFSMAFLSALAGNSQNVTYWTNQRDFMQFIRTNIIISPTKEKGKRVVRLVFQRVVYNPKGLIRSVETITDATLYQEFFQKLSKSIFLEGHNI
ncbi:MAG: hypothetical protein RBQ81_03465 [Arcobacteraceae bacterium]|jgi:hypothetical protein|nr:hypothetical protein [Arcobacteraceae bacterium]